jgi:hypothetical protein
MELDPSDPLNLVNSGSLYLGGRGIKSVTGIRLSVADRSPFWLYAKLIPQDCADLIHSLSFWG